MTHRTDSQSGIIEPDDQMVLRRLAELGIPLNLLAHSLRAGYAESDLTTAAHPVTFPGILVWGVATGELRTGLAQRGWRLDDTDNVARAISPDGDVTVVVVSGNEYTGMRNKYDKMDARRARGPAGIRIVKENEQIALIFEEDVSRGQTDLVRNLDGTWFLLHHRVDDIIRSELSYARAVDSAGRLRSWGERLILPDIDLLQASPGSGGTDSPDVDVPVKKRKAG